MTSSTASPGSTGFGVSCRLRRGRDFDRLFESAESLVGRTMVMRALPALTDESRCGVIASKRTFRRAVDRNRAKRLLREAFRLDRQALPFACDVVLVARRYIIKEGIDPVRRDFCALAANVKRFSGGQA